MSPYPITREVFTACRYFPGIAASLDLAGETRSSLEIVRLLGNTHYVNVEQCLALIERVFMDAGPIGRRLLRQTDTFQFNQALAELFLFAYLDAHMPGRVQPVEGRASDRSPDMEIDWSGGRVLIEVYAPTDFTGFQLLQHYLIRVLKYLAVGRGFHLTVALEVPGADDGDDPTSGFAYPYLVPNERAVRPWLNAFEHRAASWLANAEPATTLVVDVPGDQLRVRVAVSRLFTDAADRQVIFSAPTRSTDTRLFFECGTAVDTAGSQWGRKLREKLSKRQCGEPADDVLRMLVVNFSHADTGWPDFICWPRIAHRLDEVIRLLAGGDVPPYDLVLPAQLGLDCCFGVPIWLRRPPLLRTDGLLHEAGLTVPCRSNR